MPPNPKSKATKPAKAKAKPNRPRGVTTRVELAMLVGRAIALEEFHRAFKADPAKAAKAIDGITLSKNDLDAIEEIKWDEVDPLIEQLRGLLPPATGPKPQDNLAGW